MTYAQFKVILDTNPEIRKYYFSEFKRLIKHRYSQYVVETTGHRSYYIKSVEFEDGTDQHSVLNYIHSNYKVNVMIVNKLNITINNNIETWYMLLQQISNNIDFVLPYSEKPFWYSTINGTIARGNYCELNTIKWLRTNYKSATISNEGDTASNKNGVDLIFNLPNSKSSYTIQCKIANVKLIDDFYKITGIIQPEKIHTNYVSVQNDDNLYIFKHKGLTVNGVLYFHKSQLVDKSFV